MVPEVAFEHYGKLQFTVFLAYHDPVNQQSEIYVAHGFVREDRVHNTNAFLQLVSALFNHFLIVAYCRYRIGKTAYIVVAFFERTMIRL